MEKELDTTNMIAIRKDDGLVVIRIPDERIDQIINLGEDSTFWLKVSSGGFVANDRVIPQLIGIITDIVPYFVRWEGKVPTKIPISDQIPDGFEIRCDIKVLVDGQVVGISLSKSTVRYQLSPYIRSLKNSGVKPEEVFSRLRVKQATNAYGTFNVVIFECVGPAKTTGPPNQVPPAPVTEVASESSKSAKQDPWT